MAFGNQVVSKFTDMKKIVLAFQSGAQPLKTM